MSKNNCPGLPGRDSRPSDLLSPVAAQFPPALGAAAPFLARGEPQSHLPACPLSQTAHQAIRGPCDPDHFSPPLPAPGPRSPSPPAWVTRVFQRPYWTPPRWRPVVYKAIGSQLPPFRTPAASVFHRVKSFRTVLKSFQGPVLQTRRHRPHPLHLLRPPASRSLRSSQRLPASWAAACSCPRAGLTLPKDVT